MALSPSWFVDVDSRKLVFINPAWNFDVKKEIKSLEKRGIYYPEKLFRTTCHQLASNAEENSRYEEASNFRRIALEMERIEKWESFRKSFKAFSKKKSYKSKSNNFLIAFLKLTKEFFLKTFNLLLHFFYMLTSFYGENWTVAGLVLLLILVISTFLYTTSYSAFRLGEQGLNIWEAISYSLRVMALQRPEPQPVNNFAKIVVAFETILAPLQLALLALAIRRKFMR